MDWDLRRGSRERFARSDTSRVNRGLLRAELDEITHVDFDLRSSSKKIDNSPTAFVAESCGYCTLIFSDTPCRYRLWVVTWGTRLRRHSDRVGREPCDRRERFVALYLPFSSSSNWADPPREEARSAFGFRAALLRRVGIGVDSSKSPLDVGKMAESIFATVWLIWYFQTSPADVYMHSTLSVPPGHACRSTILFNRVDTWARNEIYDWNEVLSVTNYIEINILNNRVKDI